MHAERSPGGEKIGYGGFTSAERSTSTVPLILRQILVDPNEPEDLPARGLKVEMRIRNIQYLDAELDDLPSHFIDIIGF